MSKDQIKSFTYNVDELIDENHDILKEYWNWPTYKGNYKNADNLIVLQTSIQLCDDYLEKARYMAGRFYSDGYNNISAKSKLQMIIDNLMCVKNRCDIFSCLLSHSEKFTITTHGNEGGYLQSLNDDESSDKIVKLSNDVQKWIDIFSNYI